MNKTARQKSLPALTDKFCMLCPAPQGRKSFVLADTPCRTDFGRLGPVLEVRTSVDVSCRLFLTEITLSGSGEQMM